MTPLPFSCRFHAAEICSPKLGQALMWAAASSSPTRRRFLANARQDLTVCNDVGNSALQPPQHRAWQQADRSGRLAAFEMTAQPGDRACLWCGRGFAPRSDGGKRQLFCRPACPRGFDAAGRRWVAEAIATGVLAVDALRNGPATTRALVRAPTSPTPVGDVPSQHPTSVASRVANSYRRQRDFELLMAKAIATRRR